jgi:hypothetical protein
MTMATTPKLVLDREECVVLVIPQGEPLADNWYICMNDQRYIALVPSQYLVDVHCDCTKSIIPHEWIDISDCIDCDNVVAEGNPTWGALKSIYR